MPQATASWATGTGPGGEDAVDAIRATWDVLEEAIGSRAWYRTGERPDRPVGRDDIPTLLDEGRNRDDGQGDVIESLGRKIRLWDDDGGSLSAAVEGTGKTWRGHCLFGHPSLPMAADRAWPLLQELIRIWRPDVAAWTTTDLTVIGRRAGLIGGRPPMGLLTWVRDGVEAPFVGGETLRTDGGTLYRFGDDIADITAETVQQVIRAT